VSRSQTTRTTLILPLQSVSFGSIVVDDPVALTKTIFEAVEKTGMRALVSAGWSDIGGENVPKNVFILGESRSSWHSQRNEVLSL
jgi:UDP:flavonoid glycosyltransferase YjiC (YdhE family)